MRPGDYRDHGAALLERVRHQVNTDERLGLVTGRHRSRRVLQVALVAAAIVILVASVTLFRAADSTPVVTRPESTTTTTLASLPVELFLAVADYTIDADTGTCSGAGPLVDVTAGSRIAVVDDRSGQQIDSIELPTGIVVTRATDEEFLFPSDHDELCLFIRGLVVDHHDHSLMPESDLDVGSSATRSGQRVAVVLGG